MHHHAPHRGQHTVDPRRAPHRSSAGAGHHHARGVIDRRSGVGQPRDEQRELLDTGLPGPARPDTPAQEQRDRVRVCLRRGLGRVAAEPQMPQILVGDTNHLQVLVQHRPIPLPGRQTHREYSHGLSLSGRQSLTTTSHEHHTPGETPNNQPNHADRATSRNRSGNPGEGLRIGELCGLHLIDLHLRENAACGQCRTPHVHICHRPNNPNGAEAKTKHPWRIEDGIVTGGLIKRVSPAVIHTYFDYITTEYPRGTTDHGMLLVQLHGTGGAAAGAGGGAPDAGTCG